MGEQANVGRRPRSSVVRRVFITIPIVVLLVALAGSALGDDINPPQPAADSGGLMPKTISDSLLMSLAVVAVVLAVLTFSMPYFLGPDEDDSGRLRLYSAVTSVHIVWFVIVFLCIVVVANLTIAGGEILHSPSTLAFGRVLWFLILELLFIFLLGFLSEMPAKVKRDLAEKKLSGERLQDAADKIYRAIIRP